MWRWSTATRKRRAFPKRLAAAPTRVCTDQHQTGDECMPRRGRDSHAGDIAYARTLALPARVAADSQPHAPPARNENGGSQQPEHMDGTRAAGIAPPISGSAASSACSHASATRHTLIAHGRHATSPSHRPAVRHASVSSHRHASEGLHRPAIGPRTDTRQSACTDTQVLSTDTRQKVCTDPR